MRVLEILYNNWRMKLASIIIAGFIYYVVRFYLIPGDFRLSGLDQRQFRQVPIVAKIAANRPLIFNISPTFMDIVVQGEKSQLERLSVTDIELYADLMGVEIATDLTLSLRLSAPEGIQLMAPDPTVKVQAYLAR
jgi:hypothetical protein